ncbi:hemolysin family protein [Terrisporobacter sp.]|uniref:hemolysin family protein n=1 Tax=Terrisporobacter sp. TaxID=1965305 RepID=UPI00260E73C4|nr:hemolysin family protein [Terrisporobacter sp.]
MSSLDDLSRSVFPQLLIILILTLINAFFASAEMAFVSVNKHKIKSLSENRNKKAILLEKLLEDPSNFLSTIQIGITLAGFFSSASAATTLSVRLFNVLSLLNIPYAREFSMILITLILSFLTLIFGELVPKRIALKSCEKIALFSVKPVYVLSKIANPIIKILSLSTKIVLKLLKINDVEEDDNISTEEIKLLITQSEKNGTINYMEKEIIDKVFDFSDKMSKEIMTSRTDTILLDINDDIQSKLQVLLSSKYSRVPVYEDSVDNIIGILYVKDLISILIDKNFDSVDLRTILHYPCFVPETKKIDELFLLLKQSKNHMSILIDEYGGFSGIVTMEDIIEEIMGDIDDEYDIDNSKIKDLGDDTFIIKGNMSILDFNNFFSTNIKCEDCDTINGYIISSLNRIPCSGENINLLLDTYQLTVLDIDDNRIENVKVNLCQEKVS